MADSAGLITRKVEKGQEASDGNYGQKASLISTESGDMQESGDRNHQESTGISRNQGISDPQNPKKQACFL